MNSKIQQLTETIYNEGVEKARKEADAIIGEAQARAAEIEAKAKKEAEQIVADAQVKSEELKRQVAAEIKMSLNQAVSAMKQEITSLISMKVLQPSVKELFSDPVYMQSLILQVTKGWIEKENYDLQVILPEKDKTKMDSYFKNNLASELNKGLEISFSKNLRSGFKIGPSGGSYQISFTDEDFINYLKGYLRPKTSQMLFEEK